MNNIKKKSDAITRDMMEWLIVLLSNKNAKVKQRTLLAMFLLYCTGLRISELLTFRVMNLNELIRKGSTRVTVLKSKNNITISKHITPNQAKEIVNGRLSISYNLMVDKKLDSDDLFTTYSTGGNKGGKGNLLTRKQFIREINRELKVMNEVKFASKLRLTSHGFRAGYITRRLRQTSVKNVASMIGHKNISSTFEYDRNVMTDVQVQHLQDTDWVYVHETKLLPKNTKTVSNNNLVNKQSVLAKQDTKKDYIQIANDLFAHFKN